MYMNLVKNTMIPITEITEEHKAQMTNEEYDVSPIEDYKKNEFIFFSLIEIL
jgi:hypothetical protein